MADKKTGEKIGFFRRIPRYFKDVAGEFKKIAWPTKKTALNNTLVVLGFCVVVGLFIWGVDLLLTLIVNLLLRGA